MKGKLLLYFACQWKSFLLRVCKLVGWYFLFYLLCFCRLCSSVWRDEGENIMTAALLARPSAYHHVSRSFFDVRTYVLFLWYSERWMQVNVCNGFVWQIKHQLGVRDCTISKYIYIYWSWNVVTPQIVLQEISSSPSPAHKAISVIHMYS